MPNRAIIVRNPDGGWVQCDDLIFKHCKETGEKPIRVILTISHTNHLVIDNRPDNLRALCQMCHLNHDRQHSLHMKRVAKLTKFQDLQEQLLLPGSENLLPHVFAVYRAKRNTTITLEKILEKRRAKNYESGYDDNLEELCTMYRRQASTLLKWACDVLADAYNMPDPMAFYLSYYGSELNLIGAKT